MASKYSGKTPSLGPVLHPDTETWQWNLAPANASQVALAPDGTIWALAAGSAGTNRSIWHYTGGGWHSINALGAMIAIAPDGTLWDLTAAGSVWHYANGSWTGTGGNVSDITVDRSGNVWAVATVNGTVWEYTNGSWGQTAYSGYKLASNPDSSLYVLLSNGQIWDAPANHCIGSGGVDITPKPGGLGFYVLSGAFNGSFQIWDYTDATPGDCRTGSYNATGYYASSVSYLGNTLAVVANGNVYTTITNLASCTPPASGGTGYDPCDLQSAYDLPSTSAGTGQTIGIVDAYDDPNAEADLGVYRSTYGLPACTTANGCFKKVSQTGTTSYPAANSGWAGEISLDVDMASAICPNCHIVLVEATTNSLSDLGTSVNQAVTQGATVVSGSFGGPEFAGESTYDVAFYTHPGVPMFLSAGDDDYGAQYPATSPNVVAVGGTALVPSSSNRGWSETAWGFTPNLGGNPTFIGTGSGCSAYESKPSWQVDGGCGARMEADVAAVADLNTGVRVYNTYASTGWEDFGGTSVAAPVIAGIAALAGGTVTPSFIYAHSNQLWNITEGTNGPCPGVPQYFCFAGIGYNGPTGLGSPNGLGAFGGAQIAAAHRPILAATEIARLSASYAANPTYRAECAPPKPGYAMCYAIQRVTGTSRLPNQ